MLTVEQARVYDRKMRSLDRSVREASRDDVMRAMGWGAPGGGRPSSPPGLSRSLGGAGAGVVLDLLDTSKGTHTRASAATYISGPLTNGDTPCILTAAANQRRAEYDPNLPSGYGLLMEGGRANVIGQSRSFTSWSLGASYSEDIGWKAVDGGSTAWRFAANSGGFGRYVGFGGIPAGNPAVCTSWQRRHTADESYQSSVSGSTLVSVGAASGMGTAFQRTEVKSTGPSSFVPVDARDQTANGGIAANAHHTVVDMVQAEEGHFPSSAIPNATGAALTRMPDQLTYAVGQYPDPLRYGGRLTIVPIFSSAEAIASGALAYIIAGVDASNTVAFGFSGGNLELRLAQGGINRFQRVITFARYTAIDIAWQFSGTSALLSCAGAATGNGTWAGSTGGPWPSLPLSIGHQSGSYGFFGRYGRFFRGY
jgi:hypothetical protein